MFKTYNPGHKTMKQFKILVQVLFTTSKVVHDICYRKNCLRVASRVAERLKTQNLTEKNKCIS